MIIINMFIVSVVTHIHNSIYLGFSTNKDCDNYY